MMRASSALCDPCLALLSALVGSMVAIWYVWVQPSVDMVASWGGNDSVASATQAGGFVHASLLIYDSDDGNDGDDVARHLAS